MTQRATPNHERDTVVVFGGKGGLEARYREAVERAGYEFRYYEARMPAHGGPSASRIAWVIVVAGMVSHALMARARSLAGDPSRILYVRTASLSALRHAITAKLPDGQSSPRRAA